MLDGITRWNAARSAEALSSSSTELRTFDDDPIADDVDDALDARDIPVWGKVDALLWR